MKRWIPLLTVIALVAVGCGETAEHLHSAAGDHVHGDGDEHAADLAADRQVIDAGTSTWIEAFNGGNAAGIAALHPEDGIIFPPNAGPTKGRENIQAFWQGFIDTGAKAELTVEEIKVDGDLGYKVGGFKVLGPDGETLDEGHYLEIWERRDGEWVFARDIWNSDLPRAEDAAGD